ncbi:MAG: DUF4270 family protein [Chitinophagaceae bacterium]
MKHKQLALTLGVLITSTLILLISCKKINESTTLGGDLVPAVDNITTFDTTLDVQAFNDTFSLTTDSTRYNNSYTHFLGQINNDPFFGKTDARLFLELKPSTYKYTFANKPDSLYIDSVVLVLDYVETFGDTVTPQTVNVYEIDNASDFRYDTAYKIRQTDITKAGLLGSRTFIPYILNDSIKVFDDTTANQLRITLDNAFGQRLLNYDTISSGTNAAYISDSAFRSKFKGFALESVSGNAIMGFNLSGANTKLAIYYRFKKNTVLDTTVAYFKFSENQLSASASFIKRDYAGTPLEASVDGIITPDPLIYIQSTPGSFATIKVPGLAGLTNRVVHRAELIMDQVYDLSDTLFPPTSLYLDAYDPSVSTYRIIPYDVSFGQTGIPNLAAFGSSPFNTKDAAGNNIKSWHFNITRYVQHVVNDTEPSYDFRLSEPLYVRELYRPGVVNSTSTQVEVPVNTSAGNGRVRLAGNTGIGDTNPHRMRLRIVYSKI